MSPSEVKEMLRTARKYETDPALTIWDLKREFAAGMFPFPFVAADDGALMQFGHTASGFFRWSSVPEELLGLKKIIVVEKNRVLWLSDVRQVGDRRVLSGRCSAEPVWRILLLAWPEEFVDVAKEFAI